jgi:hypothetical protein
MGVDFFVSKIPTALILNSWKIFRVLKFLTQNPEKLIAGKINLITHIQPAHRTVILDSAAHHNSQSIHLLATLTETSFPNGQFFPIGAKLNTARQIPYYV